MTPSARLSALIELYDAITAASGPAERVIRSFFKLRRYAGSKDRRWISDTAYALLRRQGEIDWLLEAAGLVPDSRHRALLAVMRFEDLSVTALQEAYLSGTYAIPALTGDEITALGTTESRALADIPERARGNMPEWLLTRIEAQYGARAGAVLASFQDRAPLTLRVNTLASDRASVLERFQAVREPASPTTLSPDGIILEKRSNLASHPLLEEGAVEIQDEAAQISARLADALPGMSVADFCAGAGGKSLAMAATMQNEGRIFACDIDKRRMRDLSERKKRAGAWIIQTCLLADPPEASEIYPELVGKLDRVFVDAPCSGSGTWRRQPDQKWRCTPARLDELVKQQAAIISDAAALVAPGGRLIYATCSLLQAENADQIAAFLVTRPDFTVVPVASLWADLGPGGTWDGDFLELTPDMYGTDGFFTAVLQRKG